MNDAYGIMRQMYGKPNENVEGEGDSGRVVVNLDAQVSEQERQHVAEIVRTLCEEAEPLASVTLLEQVGEDSLQTCPLCGALSLSIIFETGSYSADKQVIELAQLAGSSPFICTFSMGVCAECGEVCGGMVGAHARWMSLPGHGPSNVWRSATVALAGAERILRAMPGGEAKSSLAKAVAGQRKAREAFFSRLWDDVSTQSQSVVAARILPSAQLQIAEIEQHAAESSERIVQEAGSVVKRVLTSYVDGLRKGLAFASRKMEWTLTWSVLAGVLVTQITPSVLRATPWYVGLPASLGALCFVMWCGSRLLRRQIRSVALASDIIEAGAESMDSFAA